MILMNTMMLMTSTSKRYNFDVHVINVDATLWTHMLSIRAPICYLWESNYSVTLGLNWMDAHVANVDAICWTPVSSIRTHICYL